MYISERTDSLLWKKYKFHDLWTSQELTELFSDNWLGINYVFSQRFLNYYSYSQQDKPLQNLPSNHVRLFIW